MLSVTSATVHQTMCPSTPKSNSTPTRLNRSDRWEKCHIYRRNSSKNCNPLYSGVESLTDVPNKFNNVSFNVVAATTSGTPERELQSISLTINKNVWTKNEDDDDSIVANDNINSEQLWTYAENDISLTATLDNDDISGQENDCTVRGATVERKRKRGIQNRMENTAKYLRKSDNISIIPLPNTNQLNIISNASNDENENNLSPSVNNEGVNLWTAKDDEENSKEKWYPDNNFLYPHYMTGFPNPPGENRCWLNATLQALFILPLIDHLPRHNLNQSSRLTQILVAMRHHWKKGVDERDTTYQIVKKFKEELAILDKTYPSQKQQDVSEFLTIFLNYIKTECEQLAMASRPIMRTNSETKNIRKNGQDIINNAPRIQSMSRKRTPLTEISSVKQENGTSETINKSDTDKPSQKNNGIESTEITSPTNPIDDFFLLHMLEHYICKGCSEHRQKKIDNLMFYVDIPGNETEVIDLKEAIDKSMEPEERSLTCAKCKHTEHNMSTSFRSSPNVLMVQINRYRMTNEGIVEKINTAVNISDELTLKSYNDNEIYRFKPVSIIAHVGSAVDCGHYTSYAVHNDQWIHYNDMDVVPMSRDEALTAAQTTAYLIFYVNAKFYSANSNMLRIEKNSL